MDEMIERDLVELGHGVSGDDLGGGIAVDELVFAVDEDGAGRGFGNGLEFTLRIMQVQRGGETLGNGGGRRRGDRGSLLVRHEGPETPDAQRGTHSSAQAGGSRNSTPFLIAEKEQT